jgi:PAS domain S-box-containing protein
MAAPGAHGREESGVACRDLATALTNRSDEVVARWEAVVRERAVARPLSEPALRDNLPKILSRLSDALSTGDLASALSSDASEQHALDRLSRGFVLGDLVSEYAVLRQCIMDVVADTPGCDVSHVRVVDRVVDHAIETAVSCYAEANQRVLAAVDRLSREALGSWSLDELLSRLLTVIMESTVATDTATILLREGDRLRVRAAVGLVAERDAEFSLAIGEGFAGTIGATRAPLMLRDAAHDPLIKSEFIRDRQVRGLYGVPLTDGEELIGVAHMGSLTAFGFGQADMLLFRAIAQRAAALITEMRLRQRLDEESRLLNAILQQVPAGVLVAGSDGCIRTSNRAVATIWRDPFTPSELDAYRVGEVFDMDGQVVPSTEYPLTVALRERRDTTRELRITRGDGSHGYVLSSASPVLDDRGQLLAAVVAFVDITELKETQHRLEREAEFRERFLGVLGHDLRNPLAAILLAVRRLEARADLPAGIAATIARIGSSASRMRRMIDELLDFVRARATGQLPLNRAPVDLRQVLEQVVAETELAGAGGRVTTTTSGDVMGVWDPDRLVQMVDNLVRNALRYGAPDRPVRLEAAGGPEGVDVVVANEGAEISPERQQRLFEPFQRGQNQDGEGLGLGLFIVNAVATSHGGRVGVASSGGETRFLVHLPRQPPPG